MTVSLLQSSRISASKKSFGKNKEDKWILKHYHSRKLSTLYNWLRCTFKHHNWLCKISLWRLRPRILKFKVGVEEDRLLITGSQGVWDHNVHRNGKEKHCIINVDRIYRNYKLNGYSNKKLLWHLMRENNKRWNKIYGNVRYLWAILKH